MKSRSSKLAPRSMNQILSAVDLENSDIPITPPRRGKNRPRNEAEIAHQQRVAEIGCIICKLLGEEQLSHTEIHHVRQNRLRADCHMDVLPLCSNLCHRGKHSVHGDRSRLYRTKKSQSDLLEIVTDILAIT